MPGAHRPETLTRLQRLGAAAANAADAAADARDARDNAIMEADAEGWQLTEIARAVGLSTPHTLRIVARGKFYLFGYYCLAIGLFASSLTQNQINSYFMAFAIGLLLLITGWAGQLTSSNIGQVLSYLSITDHYKQFAQGVIDSKDVVYYGTLMTFFLFLTKQTTAALQPTATVTLT